MDVKDRQKPGPSRKASGAESNAFRVTDASSPQMNAACHAGPYATRVAATRKIPHTQLRRRKEAPRVIAVVHPLRTEDDRNSIRSRVFDVL